MDSFRARTPDASQNLYLVIPSTGPSRWLERLIALKWTDAPLWRGDLYPERRDRD
jgi:hypothetical protein